MEKVMSQDMDAESILEMSSDIDEIEKEKAIESIILETRPNDDYEQNLEESDISMEVESIPIATNNPNNVEESPKRTDIENCGEIVENDVKSDDKLDDEKPTIKKPTLVEITARCQKMIDHLSVRNSVSASVVPTPPNKVVYVKILPKISTQSTVTPATPQSPPKAISIATLKDKYQRSHEKTEVKKVSPIKIAVDEPTTSNLSSSSRPPISGHTVNLLNNNRILIKSVKNNHANNAHVPISTSSSKKCATTEEHSNPNESQTNTDTVKPQIREVNKVTFCDVSNTLNVKQTEVIERSDEKNAKYVTESNNGNVNDVSEIEIKKEQLLNENSEDNIIDDSKLNEDTVNDDTNLLSAQKIKREFEQLQKTVNESKVLSEFIIQHNKRIRRPTKSSKSKHKHNNSLQEMNNSIDDKMLLHLARSVSPSSSSVRSASKESDRSVTSSVNAGSATGTGKRNTRSMNTDFSAKQKQFLKGIQQVTRGTDDETDNNSGVDDDYDDLDYYTKQQPSITERRKSMAASKQNFGQIEIKTGWDKYCWRCHQSDSNLFCSCCIRSYHANCLKIKVLSPAEMAKWQCPECIEIKAAEKENKKKKFDVKHFNKLLKYAMNRILQDPNLQQFQFPVNKTQNPGYSDIIVNPINLSKIEDNIDNLVYTNSEAFLTDIKWILHNCSIYFSDNYKVTRAAKSLQKVSKQEVGDIETCPECYLNANTMTDNWFTETCAKPHLILWAKLKGFPYWPAKAMSINSTLVDVRFFGEHDRANIPAKDCYLYSREDPNPPTNKYKRNTIADCVKEVDVYVDNIVAKYNSFKYAELKTPFNPQLAEQHLFDMIPGLRSARGRRRSSTVARPDLTLKIVKTADNHLSVVKKDQTAKEMPQIKRTVDITGEGTVSRTPTPPSAVLARRKTSDTRIKRSKSTNRHSDGKMTTLDQKSYQVLRRKSMAVEKLDQKRVNAIHSTLDLNSTNESSDVGFVRYNPKPMNEKIETDLIANAVTKKKVTAKKRKFSMDQAKTSDANDTPEKNQKMDDAKPTTSTEEEIPQDNFQGNILSSVGLMKKTSVTPIKSTDKSNTVASEIGRNKNSTCDKEEINDGSARTRTDAIRRPTNKEETAPLILMPFVEVKTEPEIENIAGISGGQTPSQATISLVSSTETTPAKNYCSIEESLSNIKTETSSDDDSLMIIDDELSNNSSIPAKLSGIDQFRDSLQNRGAISVKDINKMTSQSQQNARKTFPTYSSNSSTSILKPRNNTTLNKPGSMNQTNMVCIPLDGSIRLDLNYNSSKPPPLSVVGSSNSVSLLAQNQNQSSNSTSTNTSMSNLTNGPPPLSITSIPSMVNVSQTSLLNPLSMNTISNGLLTDEMASSVTDQIIRRNPPQLSSRPAAPLRSDGGSMFSSEAGSVSKTLIENSHKMSDFFRSVIEDTLGDLANMGRPEAKIRIMELEMEKIKNEHAKELTDARAEITEAKTNTDRLLTEMKKNMEKERTRIINETRRQCEAERIRSVEEAKKKQWCSNCWKEAQFYCCWNTSYCNHFCQRKHWEEHMSVCAQVESPNIQNLRKPNAKSASKSEARQPQNLQSTKSQSSVQKDNLNAIGQRASARASSIAVPALRNILPKHSMGPLSQRASNQSAQPQTKQASNQQCIILGRSLPNWAGSSSKSTSLLHPNAFFLPSSSQPYATLNVQSGSSSGVSLLNSSHAQGQKSNTTETIIIP